MLSHVTTSSSPYFSTIMSPTIVIFVISAHAYDTVHIYAPTYFFLVGNKRDFIKA